MGTVVQRKRKDGSMGYMARVRIMRQGRIFSETETFDRKVDASAWLKRRETELSKPGALEQREDPPLADVIDRYIAESMREIKSTKAQVLRTIKKDQLASMASSTITSAHIMAFFKRLTGQPQTVGNYASHLSSVFAIARPAWGYQLDYQAIKDATMVARRLGVISKSKAREKRPSVAEMDALMEHFGMVRSRPRDSIPMQDITVFALFSSRRLAEVLRIRWDDLDEDRVLVRKMKNPGDNDGIDTWCELPPEAVAVIRKQPRTSERIFPYNTDAVGMAFTRGCQRLQIEGISFHSLRHEAVSRLFEMGRTIPQVASVSGHRSWQSLQRYAHIRKTGDKWAGWKWLEMFQAKDKPRG